MTNPAGASTPRVTGLWRYPLKSAQGLVEHRLRVAPGGIEGDRTHGLIDVASGRLMSAKRTAALLGATATDHGVTLPDGTTWAYSDPGIDAGLSAWLGRDVHLATPDEVDGATYEMTFDPPNEDAEVFEIPAPAGTFLDLCDLHLVTTATLAGCAEARPDLDWDVRRFRPNVLVDVDGEAFAEDAWIGRRVAIGTAVLAITGPMLRCAMPLRAQPGLEREPGLFAAMNDLHASFPNHLGLVADVVTAGEIHLDDELILD